MNSNSDQRIVRGLQRGQQRAWLALHDTYAQRLWRAIARLIPNAPSAVGDIVQEALMEAARSARNYDGSKGTLWQWLYGIAHHRVANFYRQEAQQRRLKQIKTWCASWDSDARDWVQGEIDLPQVVLESSELADLVRLTMAELSEDYALLLTSRYLDGQSAVEIAHRSGATPEAIRAKLLRARRRFREVFLNHAGADAYAYPRGAS